MEGSESSYNYPVATCGDIAMVRIPEKSIGVYRDVKSGKYVIVDRDSKLSDNDLKRCYTFDRYDEACLWLSANKGVTLTTRLPKIPTDGLFNWYAINRGKFGITDKKMLKLFNNIRQKIGEEEFKHLSKPINIKVSNRRYFTMDDLVACLRSDRLKNLRKSVTKDLVFDQMGFLARMPLELKSEFVEDIREVLKSDYFQSLLKGYNVYSVEYDGRKYRFFDSKEDVAFREEVASNDGKYIFFHDDVRITANKVKGDQRLLEYQNGIIKQMSEVCRGSGKNFLYF